MKEYVELIKEYKNAYDVIAVSAYFLTVDFNIGKLDDFADVSSTDRLMTRYRNTKNELGQILSITKLTEELITYSTECILTSDAHYRLIRQLDAFINHSKNTIHNIMKQEYRALNTNYKETGVFIFKKADSFIIDCINQTICDKNGYGLRRPKEHKNGMYNLDTIKICYREELQGMEVIFKTIPKNNTISNQLINDKKLYVALCPFVANPLQDILKQETSKNTFWFTEAINYGKTEEYINRYFTNLTNALLSKADIIVFPEMLLTEEICEQLPARIQELKIMDTKIIVAGTLSRMGKNTCLVYNNFGKLLLYQTKKHAYKDRKSNLLEKIETNHIISILDIEYLGRLLVYICKDIDFGKMNAIGKLLENNIILMPTYSKSLDIETSASTKALEELCITFMSNSCSAFNYYHSVEEYVNDINRYKRAIGAVIFPAKTKDGQRAMHIYNYCQDKQCINCHKSCSFFMVEMNFNESAFYDNDSLSCVVDINRL